jgi:lipopolysaccharide export system permease protein
MIITRYLAKEVYLTLLATTLVLLLIFFSHEFVRFMHYAATGELSSHAVMLLLLLQLPVLLAMLLPLSLFLAILIAYGRMYADNEMTILAVSGVSSFRILTKTVGFSAIIALLVAILSLYIGPRVANYSNHLWTGGTSNALDLLSPNRFNPIDKGKWIFYVNAISPDKKHLVSIFAAEQPPGNAIADKPLGILVAKGGYQQVDKATGDLFLVLTNGYRYMGVPGQNDYQIIKYDQYGVRLQQDVGSWRRDESSIATKILWQEKHNNLAAAELQWRISLPLTVFILSLLGAVLSRVKVKHSRYAQIIPAIMCYIIYTNLLFMSRAWLKKGIIPAEYGMWWTHILMLLFTIVIILYQSNWQCFGFFKKNANFN